MTCRNSSWNNSGLCQVWNKISKLLAKVESLEAQAMAHPKATANIPLSLAEIAKEVQQQDDKKFTVVFESAAETEDEATNNAADKALAESRKLH
ncbi:unnamed protein product [Bursaphelenchus xylophilus]|uniref:(pine wood nematode) hypothetical protein n=1 Tax=Bursaphelenchus xylophilus TaxID=6326 RepID=A0A1I7RXA5_BURXY|nr:unnamed protein product [Bursaphelenchus xylophilus]CAG9121486.1 unnamed protein product [Bursaphelenchus xylophilus]